MKLFFSAQAKKDFLGLNLSNQKKVKRQLEILKQSPLAGKKLRGELKGLLSLKAWPYRIIYQKLKTKIIVVTIRHRQGAY